MQTFWSQIANIQKDAVIWMHQTVLSMLPKVEGQIFVQCLYKLLMMAAKDLYCQVNWEAIRCR